MKLKPGKKHKKKFEDEVHKSKQNFENSNKKVKAKQQQKRIQRKKEADETSKPQDSSSILGLQTSEVADCSANVHPENPFWSCKSLNELDPPHEKDDVITSESCRETNPFLANVASDEEDVHKEIVILKMKKKKRRIPKFFKKPKKKEKGAVELTAVSQIENHSPNQVTDEKNPFLSNDPKEQATTSHHQIEDGPHCSVDENNPFISKESNVEKSSPERLEEIDGNKSQQDFFTRGERGLMDRCNDEISQVNTINQQSMRKLIDREEKLHKLDKKCAELEKNAYIFHVETKQIEEKERCKKCCFGCCTCCLRCACCLSCCEKEEET